MRNKNGKTKTKGLIGMTSYSLMIKRPYEEISVKDICEKAGVSRMSFYRYYNKKDDIFVDYCDERFEEFYSLITTKKVFETGKELTLEIFKFIQKYYRQIKILTMANKEFMLLDQLNSYTKYVVSNLKTEYLLANKNNPVFAYCIAGGLFNVIMFWVRSGMKNTPEEMNEMLYKLIDGRVF